MKKLLTPLIFLFLLCHSAFAQTAFYNAQYLATITQAQRQMIFSLKGEASAQLTDDENLTLKALNDFFSGPFTKIDNANLLNPITIKDLLPKLKTLADEKAAADKAAAHPSRSTSLKTGLMNFDEYSTRISIPTYMTDGSNVQSITGGSSAGSFNSANIQTMLIDATAKYLAKSFKEDVTYRYFVLLKEKINANPIFINLLPQTCRAVEKIDPFNFKNLGTSWKAAFESDMQNLPVSFVTFINSQPNTPWCAKIAQSDYFKYYSYAVDILNPLIKGQTPVQILQTLDNNYYSTPELNDAKKSYKSFIHFVNLLQTNLQDSSKVNTNKQYDQWVSFAQLKQLNTPVKIGYFCALIYQQDPQFFDKDILGKQILPILNKVDNQAKFMGSLSNWLTVLNQVEAGVQEIRTAKTNGTNTTSTIGIYMKNVLAITDSANSILIKFSKDNQDLKDLTKALSEGIQYGKQADTLYTDITGKNYGGAITRITSLLAAIDKKESVTLEIIKNAVDTTDLKNAIQDFKPFAGKEPIAQLSPVDLTALLYRNIKFNIIDVNAFAADYKAQIGYARNKAFQAQMDADLSEAIKSLNNLNKALAGNAEIKKLDSYSKIIALINKYGNVIAGVATAQNSDDLESVIENFIATSGTYVTQRTSLFTASVSAKVGLYAGGEGTDHFGSFKTNIGLSVPLGIELTWGQKSNTKTDYPYLDSKNSEVKYLTGLCKGLFIQVFDIAAVVNYRLGADSASTLPNKISFQQVFSPGLTYNIGLRNCPFDIGIGGEFTPELRQIGQDLQASTIRLFIRFSWDKPLIYLKTSGTSN